MHLIQLSLWVQSTNSFSENSSVLSQGGNIYIRTSDFNIFFSLLTSKLVSWTFCLMSLSSLWVSFSFLDSAYKKKTVRSIKGCHWQPSGQSKCSTGGWAVGQASHSRMGASGELSGECSDRHEIHRQKRFEIGMTSYIPQYKFIVLYYSKTSI